MQLTKKRFISSILLCAFAILFAHSIIPHHHHEEATVMHQSDHHDDDHEDINDNYFGQVFSHFQHESRGGVTYQTASPTFQCSNVSVDKDAVLITQYVIRQLFKPPIIHIEHPSFIFGSSHYSATPLLSGPPSLMA